jgi:hypothetical protein
MATRPKKVEYHASSHETGRIRQADAKAKAHRNGMQWTGPELELASRTDLTSNEVARMLGRTLYAVKAMRHKLWEPMPDHIAGVSKPRSSQ